MCVGMATKNISITEDAYKRLAALRKTNESFSEIINRITDKNSLRDFIGIWSGEAGDRVKENIRRIREIRKKEEARRIEKLKRMFN